MLRARIQNGEYPLGSQLPGISALQEEFDVPGLQTIRSAQQLLVEEGMLQTRQGVGAFVTSTTSLRQVDVMATLITVRDSASAAIAALAAARRRVTFDFDVEDDDAYFVLTDALREWVARQQGEAEDETDNLMREQRTKWVSVGQSLADRLDAAA